MLRALPADAFESLCAASRRLAVLAEETGHVGSQRALISVGGASNCEHGSQRQFRLVLEFCERLRNALEIAERRFRDAHGAAAVQQAAFTLYAIESIVWFSLDDNGSVLFRWIQRRLDSPGWEIDYLGLEYHFDRHGRRFVDQLLALGTHRLERVIDLLRTRPYGLSA